MSYTPTNWNTGDTITASALNKIENGIEEASQSGGGGAVIIIDDGTALDKTYAEIYDLIESGTPCYISYTAGKAVEDLDTAYAYQVDLLPVVLVYKYSDDYRVMAVSSNQTLISSDNSVGVPSMWTYSATDSSSYPTFLRQTFTSNQYLTNSNNRQI